APHPPGARRELQGPRASGVSHGALPVERRDRRAAADTLNAAARSSGDSMRPYRLASLALLLAPAALAQAPLPLKHPPQRTVPAITAGDLMPPLYILADDSPEGGEARDTAHLITPDQASGKLVVLMVAGGFGGLRALRARAAPRIKGAAAMALVALDSLPSPSLGFLRRPQAFLDDVSTAQERPIPVLLIGRAAAARMFSTPLEQLTVGAAGGTAPPSPRYPAQPPPS